MEDEGLVLVRPRLRLRSRRGHRVVPLPHRQAPAQQRAELVLLPLSSALLLLLLLVLRPHVGQQHCQRVALPAAAVAARFVPGGVALGLVGVDGAEAAFGLVVEEVRPGEAVVVVLVDEGDGLSAAGGLLVGEPLELDQFGALLLLL